MARSAADRRPARRMESPGKWARASYAQTGNRDSSARVLPGCAPVRNKFSEGPPCPPSLLLELFGAPRASSPCPATPAAAHTVRRSKSERGWSWATLPPHPPPTRTRRLWVHWHHRERCGTDRHFRISRSIACLPENRDAEEVRLIKLKTQSGFGERTLYGRVLLNTFVED
jgi:hypothetical protein